MAVVLLICAVIVTIAIVAIAVATIRSSNRLVRAIDEIKVLSADVQQWVVQARLVTENAQGILTSVQETVQPLRRVAERFEDVGDRAASLSEAVLTELERPVFNAMAVTRGIRSGAAFFFNRLNFRFKQGRHTADGRVSS